MGDEREPLLRSDSASSTSGRGEPGKEEEEVVVNVVTYGTGGGIGGSLPAEETRRILLVQGDYWAVLDVDPAGHGGDSDGGALREAFRTLRDLVQAGPDGDDRAEALTILRSAYSTLSNPVTRGLYNAWRGVFHVPGEGTPRGSPRPQQGAPPPSPQLQHRGGKGDGGEGEGKAGENVGCAGGQQRRRNHLPEWLAKVLRIPVLGVLVALLLTLLALPFVLVVAVLYCAWWLLCLPFRMCADVCGARKKPRESCV